MTVLVLDNPEMLAQATRLHGGLADPMGIGTGRPHRMRFHYGYNKHTPDSSDLAMLKQHAAYLKSHPGMKVRVHGHSDCFGSQEYSCFLARLRAHAVYRLLVLEGVAPNAILVSAWGSERPLARPEDHAANRRVELEYLSQEMAKAL
ncbi:MAG TPA: OmpA family protein [Marinobacter sp.]|nr:OmpA family protein [Marinobacter sp.]